jgi:hypothetical protein
MRFWSRSLREQARQSPPERPNQGDGFCRMRKAVGSSEQKRLIGNNASTFSSDRRRDRIRPPRQGPILKRPPSRSGRCPWHSARSSMPCCLPIDEAEPHQGAQHEGAADSERPAKRALACEISQGTADTLCDQCGAAALFASNQRRSWSCRQRLRGCDRVLLVWMTKLRPSLACLTI